MIETIAAGKGTVIQVIGEFRSEHIDELKTQIDSDSPTALDLNKASIVNIDAVLFPMPARRRRVCPEKENMTIKKIEIERLSVTSSKPFDVVVAALKAAVGRPDMVEFAKATRSARTFAELESA